ncbi:DegT/DnrJ/EryC1/StrS family aminotransferase [Sinorhizobium meliloti]|uniref:Aminotransferase class I/II-fold pyridoxal phosphate-dependent enzyme n=1 Tax=Rhizobium meliloti TaxID=382 RepID=A0AAW9TL36_RHIML|nr:DegT/DnrJ/EryC1/StrS family aminotransferase [Sinorhizobium meliloti]MQW32695.1 aminotransferase class I/II-fold pyridoxal phosphate-dependent enzyme [Sinorhizobium meliloti]
MNVKVERHNYPSQFTGIESKLLHEIRGLLSSGDYVLGEAVAEYERAFATYIGTPHAIGVNSGTDALILALHALRIGQGDEVITVANTFHATALAIVRVGAIPVLVDCKSDTFLIDLEQVERKISKRTKAVIVVHLFGQAVNMAAVHDLARRNGLLVVEDCAQAIGAQSGGKKVGSMSDAGCWSFAPAKNLAAAGDAGAITLADPEVANRLRQMRHFGQATQNEHLIAGYNSRLDTIQALILRNKLGRVDMWSAERARIASIYKERLDGLPLAFQSGAEPGEHVYHLFQVKTDSRDGLLSHLQRRGIDAVVRYPTPIHLQPAFIDLGYRSGDLPVAEALAAQTLCLPLHPAMTVDQIDFVCDSVNSFFSR